MDLKKLLELSEFDLTLSVNLSVNVISFQFLISFKINFFCQENRGLKKGEEKLIKQCHTCFFLSLTKKETRLERTLTYNFKNSKVKIPVFVLLIKTYYC